MKRFTQFLILLVIAMLVIPIMLPNKIISEVEKEFDFPADILFEKFNNLKNYSEWEAWTHTDSTLQRDFFSPYRGEGAGYKWTDQNDKNNSGEITIKKSNPHKSIEFKLEGLGLGKNSKMVVEFDSENTDKTKLKWTIESEEIGYFSRYYSYFTSNKMLEKMEESLAYLEENLKSSKESLKLTSSIQGGMEIEMFEGEKLITILNSTSLDLSEINTASEESFGKLFSYLTDYIKVPPQNLGKPISYYEYIDSGSKKAKFYCGYPISETVKLEEDMQLFSLPAGKVLTSIHKGSYDSIGQTLKKMREYGKKNKLNLNISHWETYLNDPEMVKDKNELLTKIYIPIK